MADINSIVSEVMDVTIKMTVERERQTFKMKQGIRMTLIEASIRRFGLERGINEASIVDLINRIDDIMSNCIHI